MFRRGFKTWAEQTAAAVRQQLGLSDVSPLDPRELANHLDVPIVDVRELQDLPKEVLRRLITQHSECWSALTVTDGRHHLIVFNPAHSNARINSDLMHELAHTLLDHEPSMMYVTPRSGISLRTHNKQQEDEANWLTGCLLLPRGALLHVRKRRTPEAEICSRYGISAPMLRFRLNATGVDVQLRRAASPT